MGRTPRPRPPGVHPRSPVYARTPAGANAVGTPPDRRRGVDHVSQTSAAASLVRVSVSSGTRRADLGVPGGIPVVELVPELARELGVLDAGNASHGFRLVAGGGLLVDPDRSLAAQGITDGAVLSLETVDATTDKVYDDVVEAVADVVETQFAPWTARHSAGTAIGAATVFLLCAAWALFTARDAGLVVTAVAGAVALLLVGTAAVLESRTQAVGAVALAAVSLVYAAVAGFAVQPSAPLWGEGLLYAGAAVAVVGLLAAAGPAPAPPGARCRRRGRRRHGRARRGRRTGPGVDDDGLRRRLRRRGRAGQRAAVGGHLVEPAVLARTAHGGRDRRRCTGGRPRPGAHPGRARPRRHGRRRTGDRRGRPAHHAAARGRGGGRHAPRRRGPRRHPAAHPAQPHPHLGAARDGDRHPRPGARRGRRRAAAPDLAPRPRRAARQAGAALVVSLAVLAPRTRVGLGRLADAADGIVLVALLPLAAATIGVL